MDFSELLNIRLKALGKSQKDFAEELNTSEANISRIKKGETSRTNPKPKFVKKMASILQVTYQDVYESLTGERPEDVLQTETTSATDPRRTIENESRTSKIKATQLPRQDATKAIDKALPLLRELKEKAKTEENRGIVQQIINLIAPEWDLQEIVDSFGSNRKKRLTSLKTLILLKSEAAGAFSFADENDKKYLAGDMTDREYYDDCLKDIELSFSEFDKEMEETNDQDTDTIKSGGA